MSEPNDSMPVAPADNKRLVWLKTLVIWAVLIAMFVSIYRTTSKASSTAGVLTLVLALVAVVVVILVVATAVVLRRIRRAQADINDGVAALSRGELEVASQAFTRWCGSSSTVVSALARHNLGWTLMRQGRLQEAIAVVGNNDAAHERDLKRLSLHGTSSVDLSLFSALLGKLEDAESWLEITERRAAVAANPSLSAMRVFARAVLDCRNDRCEDAARLLAERWPECEATLTGADLRPLRVVRAFSIAAAGPRSAGVADSLLATSKPVYAGEYDFLGVAWPAMDTFLMTHRLTRERAG